MYNFYILHVSHVIEYIYNIYKASVSPGSVQQIMPYFWYFPYNGSLVTWTVICLTTAKFKPFIFRVLGFALSNGVNIFVIMILYDLCLLPALFCYVIIYKWDLESQVQIANRCAPWIIANGAEYLV
jgi:hypothetical protein